MFCSQLYIPTTPMDCLGELSLCIEFFQKIFLKSLIFIFFHRLYVFRKIEKYRILVCGGDGTIGWVLQCLDNVGQDSLCSNPPCAIVPLGTGNDLARVLRWGSGYGGDEDPMALLRDVIEAEEIRLDRWTVVFRPQSEESEGADGRVTAASAQAWGSILSLRVP